MKATIDTKAMLEALPPMVKICSSRLAKQRPGLGCVRLACGGGAVRVSASSGEQFISRTITKADIRADGECAIPAQSLAAAVSACADSATFTVEMEGDRVRVSGDSATSRLFTIPVAEVCPAPSIGDVVWSDTVSSGDLARDISLTARLMGGGTAGSRYAPSGIVLIRRAKDFLAVATDCVGMCVCGRKVGHNHEGRHESIVPPNAVGSVLEFLPKEGEVEVAIGHSVAIFSGDGWEVRTVLSEGKLVDYEQVIPKSPTFFIEVGVSEVVSAIDAARFFQDVEKPGISIEPMDGKVRIKSQSGGSDGGGDFEKTISASISGKPFAFRTNAKHLSNALSGMGDGTATIEITGAKKPAMVRSADGTYTYFWQLLGDA